MESKKAIEAVSRLSGKKEVQMVKKSKSTESKSTEKAETAFTESEVQALQQIVTDWMSERIVAPPYSTEVASVIRKLGVTETQQASAAGRAAPGADVTTTEGFEPLVPNLG
jgi:hypothetical protein